MSDKITLKLDNKTVEIEQDDNGRYSLNDLFKASEAPKSKKPNEFLRHKGSNVQVLKIPSSGISRLTDLQKPEDFDSYVVQVGSNRWMKTFAPLPILYRYAAFISKEFEDVVYKAFTALSKGDVLEAAMIAESVAVPPELVKKESDTRKALCSTIKEFIPNPTRFTYKHFNDLANSAATGYCTKALTGGSMSSAKWAVKQGQPEVLQAQIACMQFIIAGLTFGSDYHTIAAMLQVRTSKNSQQLKNLVSRIPE